MCLLKCLATLIGIDAAMVVAIHGIVATLRRTRYRRRRSGTSSTATSRGRIRVRVPVQQVLSISVPCQLFGLRGRDFFRLGCVFCW